MYTIVRSHVQNVRGHDVENGSRYSYHHAFVQFSRIEARATLSYSTTYRLSGVKIG